MLGDFAANARHFGIYSPVKRALFARTGTVRKSMIYQISSDTLAVL
jgi:hypothetical protein